MQTNPLSEIRANYRGRGRVLRVKEGYNPNSSSLGSVIFAVHVAVLTAPAVLAGAAAVIAIWFAGPRKDTQTAQTTDTQEDKA